MSAAWASASTTRTSRTSRRCATRSTTWSRSWVDPLRSDVPDFEVRLGHVFDDRRLLTQALTHRSWCAENPGAPSNERLELLGDAVLGLAVAERAYERFPTMAEGELAMVRSAVVRGSALVTVAEGVELGAELLLGKGEESTGGRSKASILADAMEAVIGAVLLDGGYPAARGVVLNLFADLIDEAAVQGPGEADYKTRLQELTVQLFEKLPSYSVVGNGPEHERQFSATVSVRGEVLGEGEGRSKKGAEQSAAQAAFRRLEAEHQPEADGKALPGGTDGTASPGEADGMASPGEVEESELVGKDALDA